MNGIQGKDTFCPFSYDPADNRSNTFQVLCRRGKKNYVMILTDATTIRTKIN